MSKKLKMKYDTGTTSEEIPSLRESTQQTNGQSTIVVPEETVEKIAERIVEKKIQERNIEEKVEAKQLEKKVDTEKKLEQLIDNPSRTLFAIKAVFPFQMFPDELKVEETKVNVISRTFFASAQIHSMSLKDIKNLEVQTTLFFAKLRITNWAPIDNHLDILFLKKGEAMKARRIIEGLRMLSEQKVDLSVIPTHELLEKVENLGRVK